MQKFAVLLLISATACGPVSVPLDEAWGVCVADEDCVAVIADNVCNVPSCPSAAINAAFVEAFNAAFTDLRDSCLYIDRSGDSSSCDDESPPCVEGRCALATN
jgi:hypothetical protein